MITTVREGSKAIIGYVLDEVVKAGKIGYKVEFQGGELAEHLDFKSSKLLDVCIQYLSEKKLIEAQKNGSAYYVTLEVSAIDFLEE